MLEWIDQQMGRDSPAMKLLTTLLAALGLTALASGAFAECFGADHAKPDETAELPLPNPDPLAPGA
jgi:hypothetical protein